MPQFAFADDLQNACKCCATIARARTVDWWKRNLVPEPGDPTATVTFIRIEGRTYAVTAWHVIEIFREAAAKDGVDVEGYFLPANRESGSARHSCRRRSRGRHRALMSLFVLSIPRCRHALGSRSLS